MGGILITEIPLLILSLNALLPLQYFLFFRALFSPWDFTLFLQYLSTQELRVWMDFQNSSKFSIGVYFSKSSLCNVL